MSVLGQLKELIGSDPSSLSWRKSGELIAKHGPALVELIEAADWFSGRYTDDAARNRLFDTIRKLTQDKS